MSRSAQAYGYIQCNRDTVDEDELALRSFPYDEYRGSFEDVFSRPVPQFRCAMVAFAACNNHFVEYVPEWLSGFERLLARLHATCAQIHVDDELEGDVMSVSYLRCDVAKGPEEPEQAWYRWIARRPATSGAQSTEEIVTLVP